MTPSRDVPNDPGGAAVTDEAIFVVRRAQLASVLFAVGIAAGCWVVVMWQMRPGPHRVSASHLIAYCLAFGVFVAGVLYLLLTQSYRRRTRTWSARVSANDRAVVPPLPAGATLAVPCAYRSASGRRIAGALYVVPGGLVFHAHTGRPRLLPGTGSGGSASPVKLAIGPAATVVLEITGIPATPVPVARWMYPAEPAPLVLRWGNGESAAFSVPLAFQAERRLRTAIAELVRADATRQLAERAADEHNR